MVCIFCNQKTAVINSRPQKRSNQTWRRRQCLACRTIFTTEESVDLSGSIRVQSGPSEPLEAFCRDRLFLSVYRSVSHRKTALEDARGLTDTIIRQVLVHISTAIVPKKLISTTTAQCLKRFDRAAATHYTAHHPVG